MREWESETYEISDSDTLSAYDYDHKDEDATWISGIPKHYSIQQTNELVMQCEDQLKIDPKSVGAHFTLASYYVSQNKPGRANYHLHRVLEEIPHHKEAFELMKRHFPEDAKRYQGKTDKSSKNSSEISSNLMSEESVDDCFEQAMDYINTNRWELALPKLRQVVEAQFTHIAARRFLSDYYLQKKEYQNAILELSLLKGLKPADFQIEFNLGIANYFAGNPKRALSSFKAAFEKCKDASSLEEIKAYITQIESELKS